MVMYTYHNDDDDTINNKLCVNETNGLKFSKNTLIKLLLSHIKNIPNSIYISHNIIIYIYETVLLVFYIK